MRADERRKSRQERQRQAGLATTQDHSEATELSAELYVVDGEGNFDEMPELLDRISQVSRIPGAVVLLRSTAGPGGQRGFKVYDRGLGDEFGWTVEVALGRNRVYFLATNFISVLEVLERIDPIFAGALPSGSLRPPSARIDFKAVETAGESAEDKIGPESPTDP